MRSDNRPFFNLWIFALIAKIIIGVVLQLQPDEAYYWTWSHDLHWSFFDHPPFIAWLFWLGHPFESFMQAVRIPGILLGHFTLLIWYYILKPYLSGRQCVYFLMIALASPMLGFGSLLMTPDVPLIFFTSLSLLIYLRLLESGSIQLAGLLGLSLGLGFCSKYNVVLFFPFAFIHLFWIRGWKKLRLFNIPVIFLMFILGSLPVWIWNFANNFDSFLFQMRHGLGAPELSIQWPLAYFLIR